MRILFCSKTHPSRELGGAKVRIELAEEMEQLGWECKLLSPSDLSQAGGRDPRVDYAERLRQYLRSSADQFDVVDYDHNHLPFARTEFSRQTLFVARSVLLAQHFDRISIPPAKGWKNRLHSLAFGRKAAAQRLQQIERARVTVSEADLVNVANQDDRDELVRRGIPEEKIVVIPYGLSRRLRAGFDGVSSTSPAEPRVAFIGTFDARKGATDFPGIVSDLCAAVPGVRFRLLGTGLNVGAVLAHFPRRLRGRLEIIPRYTAEELPGLLMQCSVGIFPSYIEGFGFGVLEMLAASIPVVAYNSPGPPMMLPPELLVPRGDIRAMSGRVIELLKDKEQLAAERLRAKRRSQDFCWRTIARQTARIYRECIERKQPGALCLSV